MSLIALLGCVLGTANAQPAAGTSTTVTNQTPPGRYDSSFDRQGPPFPLSGPWLNDRKREELLDYGNVAGVGPRISFGLRAPPLGRRLPPLPEGQASETAERMRPYVAEPFFAPLSALLQEGPLSKRRSVLLQRYTTAKQQVVKGLSDEIGSAQNTSSTERRARLAAFAERQAAEVAQVEELAEEIRLDLCKTRFLENGIDWEATRNWHLGDAKRESPDRDRFEVLQAAAAFAPEFSREQRGLLQEAATEVLDRARAVTDPSAGAQAVPYVHFTPSTSRIRMPVEMPEGLQARVAAYQTLKDGLKDELSAAVFAHDRSKAQVRTSAFRELREAQAVRIDQMETLAEEIRVGLADYAYPDEPPTSPIPADLSPQIDDYLSLKVETQRAFVAKLAEVRAALPQAQAEIVPGEGGYLIQVSGPRGSGVANQPILLSLPEFHANQARRYTELVAKKKALMQALAASPGKPLETGGRSVDALLQEFAESRAQQETWNQYWGYRQAVLEPGLSAGQRRLLFSDAVGSLVAPYVR